MSVLSGVSTSNSFIDLATFSELEGFLYGGPDAVTWFVGAVQKSNWFSLIPIHLRHMGCLDFGAKNTSATLNRSGDYVCHVWFSARIPQVELVGSELYRDSNVRWTRNLMHNLFEKVSITFNELTVQEFGSQWFDFNFQFRMPGAKRVGYRNMIGDIGSMTNPVLKNTPLGTGGYFSMVFPFFFGEESGIALPVAALPFNDIKINYHFRGWEQLLTVYPGTAAVGGDAGPNTGRAATINDVFVSGSTTQRVSLQDPNTHAHYAIVHNDERVKMGDAPRDILIHQIQSPQCAPFKDISTCSTFDLRLSHSVVLFCFAAQNTSVNGVNGGSSGGQWSNYTTEPNYEGLDPIAVSSLVYENAPRLSQRSDYFSLVHPLLVSEAIPEETGYHMWSYAIHPWDALRPSGSTNYSKLANVSIQHEMSDAAKASAGIDTISGSPEDSAGNIIQWPNTNGVLVDFRQTYRHVFEVRNWNIVRAANGSLGQPVL